MDNIVQLIYIATCSEGKLYYCIYGVSIPVIVLWPFKCVANNYVGYCYALNHAHVCIIFFTIVQQEIMLQIPARMWYCSIIYLFMLLLIRLWLRANCIYPESHIRNALGILLSRVYSCTVNFVGEFR